MAPAPAHRARAGEPLLFGSPMLAAAPTWDDLARLKSWTRLPVLAKGITTAEDAEQALAAGIDGIILSNHGGRVLDSQPATIDLLPALSAAIAGRAPPADRWRHPARHGYPEGPGARVPMRC